MAQTRAVVQKAIGDGIEEEVKVGFKTSLNIRMKKKVIVNELGVEECDMEAC